MSQQNKVKQFFGKLTNDPQKEKWWFNTNYFFAGTASVIVLCILLYALVWSNGSPAINTHHPSWTSTLSFNAIIAGFLNSFGHLSWQHVLLNMLCFSACGLYLERKMGTFRLILFIPVLAFFTATAISTNFLSVNWTGYSGVNYGLYAIIITDYLFSFTKNNSGKNKFNLILGAIVIILIYIAMCYNGGVNSFGFKLYPYDLFNNMGHYSAFLAGLIIALTYKISRLTQKSNHMSNPES
jgi:membrane associated rhomboid family serine protease